MLLDCNMLVSVIAIFDIGKTNKKVFLFDEDYTIRFEKSIQIAEIKDEDGFPCENVLALSTWVIDSLTELLTHYNPVATVFTPRSAISCFRICESRNN